MDERTQARFWAKVDKSGDCWLWTRAIAQGYGRFDRSLAHRVAYEDLIGPIPDGLGLDHMCHNRDLTCKGGPTCRHRRCVNPAHLEPATHAQNSSRSPLCGAKTECVNGHEFTQANTRINVRGDRACRACDRDRANAYSARKRLAS